MCLKMYLFLPVKFSMLLSTSVLLDVRLRSLLLLLLVYFDELHSILYLNNSNVSMKYRLRGSARALCERKTIMKYDVILVILT